MYIKFWDVRGSVPSGNPGTVKVGGNTTCVEIRCGEELIVIDTGTGFRNLGMSLMKELPVKGTILYSQVHWDHIQGFPFFTPFLSPETNSGYLAEQVCQQRWKKCSSSK